MSAVPAPGSAAAVPGAAFEMQLLVHGVFWLGLLLLAVLQAWKVVVLLGFVSAVVWIYCHACSLDESAEYFAEQSMACALGMLVLLFFASTMTLTDCSMCIANSYNGHATKASLENFMLECAYFKSSFLAAFGNNTDATKWPNCFDAWGDLKPCEILETFTQIELTCRK
jgi:hypothetical protein